MNDSTHGYRQACTTLYFTPPPIAAVGDSLENVGTPALLIDFDAFNLNLHRMADLAQKYQVTLRPHAKAHKSTSIAQLQIDVGAKGICCQKLSEAYPFAAAGIKDIFISNEFMGVDKIGMAIELAKRVSLSVCVDHVAQTSALGLAAGKAGVNINVLIEVDVGQGRCGVTTVDDLLAILAEINRHASLKFHGLQAYHGGIQHLVSWQGRREAAQISAQRTAYYIKQLEERGVKCPVITGGGTGTVEFDAASGVYTEIQPGSYIFMDAQYGANSWQGELQLQHSLFIASTIMSTTRPGRIICDVGLKGLAVDAGLPVFSMQHAFEGLQYIAANDEHGIIEVQNTKQPDFLGKKVYLIPGHCDPTVNLYDRYVVFSNGEIKALWNIEARGFSQ